MKYATLVIMLPVLISTVSRTEAAFESKNLREFDLYEQHETEHDGVEPETLDENFMEKRSPWWSRRRRRRRRAPPPPSSCYVNVNGCGNSEMRKLNLPFRSYLRPACDKHDVCYWCGQHWGWSRKQCDISFKNYGKKLCPRKTWWRRNKCKAAVLLYYYIIRVGGRKNYSKRSPEWCKKSCVEPKGVPNDK